MLDTLLNQYRRFMYWINLHIPRRWYWLVSKFNDFYWNHVAEQYLWDMAELTSKDDKSIILTFADGNDTEKITNPKIVSLFKDIEVKHMVGIMVKYDFSKGVPGKVENIKRVEDKGPPLSKEEIDDFIKEISENSK